MQISSMKASSTFSAVSAEHLICLCAVNPKAGRFLLIQGIFIGRVKSSRRFRKVGLLVGMQDDNPEYIGKQIFFREANSGVVDPVHTSN
jgi:hypothetical protein